MKAVIISFGDIARQPGAPLSAAYWTGRRENENYPDWKRRSGASRHLRIAEQHLRLAVASVKRAQDCLEGKPA